MRDTTPETRGAQIDAVRQLGCEGRLRIALGMSEDARQISLDGIKRRHPELSEAAARHIMVCALYGEDLANKFARSRSTDE
ncbi:MAG: hypothetical protein ABI591_22790 [Kofleriaceae bacterium]